MHSPPGSQSKVSIDEQSSGLEPAKFLAVAARGVSVQIWPVSLRDLPGWIADRMRRAGLDPDRGAVAMIADRVEGNLLAANQEIEKLRLILGDGKVSGVRATRIHLGIPDATGRQTPQVVPGSSFTVEADLAIKALGFDPEDLPSLFGAPELGVTRWGTIGIDFRTMKTSLEGVFAAGDIVRGASLVVWAVRDGRDAAAQIHKYLLAKQSAGARSADRAVA